jgi:selenide,water dikinase
VEDPNVLVGANTVDDCAVYRINDRQAIVESLDFFTPIVDDPYDFGQIVAANALSDIYAMGCLPLFALNIIGFPRDKLPLSVLEEMIRGGISKCTEAGVPILGGHTIEDPELKYGLAVTAVEDIERIITNAGARPGDLLVLTKPLGTGIIASGIKRGEVAPEVCRRVTELMATLNDAACRAVREVGAHALTDVTGFGLLGHLSEMANASGVSAEVRVAGVPFIPEAVERARTRKVPGGTKRNLDFVRPRLSVGEGVDEPSLLLLADAQTSGGLLAAVSEEKAERLIQRLKELGTPAAALVGRIVEPQAWRISVVTE